MMHKILPIKIQSVFQSLSSIQWAKTRIQGQRQKFLDISKFSKFIIRINYHWFQYFLTLTTVFFQVYSNKIFKPTVIRFKYGI